LTPYIGTLPREDPAGLGSGADITPRGKGGFVVFAVVGSSAAEGARPDRQRIDKFTKAAVRAAAGG